MSAIVPFLFFTVFWGAIGIVVPIFLPRSENRALHQTFIILTAICCYVFWLCAFISQLNPLVGPILNHHTMFAIEEFWALIRDDKCY